MPSNEALNEQRTRSDPAPSAGTVVIFASDNGCSPGAHVKSLEAQAHFASADLRGYKADIRDRFKGRTNDIAPAVFQNVDPAPDGNNEITH